MFRLRRAALLPLVLAALAGCAPTIAPFSAHAYEQAVTLKVDALALMASATEPFGDYRAEVEALRRELAKAHEFARGRPRNELSTRQWEVLTAPDRNLLGGFLARWEAQGTLSPLFVQEARLLVSDAFDTVIGLESGKVRASDVE